MMQRLCCVRSPRSILQQHDSKQEVVDSQHPIASAKQTLQSLQYRLQQHCCFAAVHRVDVRSEHAVAIAVQLCVEWAQGNIGLGTAAYLSIDIR